MNLPYFGVQDKKFNRTNYTLGMLYYDQNLFFKKNLECWSVFKITPYTYELIDKRRKLEIHNKLTRLFWELGTEFHMIDVPVETSIYEKHEKLKRRINSSNPIALEAIREIDRTTEILKHEMPEGNEYECYLAVKLEKPNVFFKNFSEMLKSIIQDPVRLINKISGLDTPEIFKREYEAYLGIEDTLFKKLRNIVSIERTESSTTEMLLKFLLFYGIGMPQVYEEEKISSKVRNRRGSWNGKEQILYRGDEAFIRPDQKKVLRMMECGIDILPLRHLEVNQFYNGTYRTGYQAYLSVSELPLATYAVGGEWHHYLKEMLGFPIYTSVRGTILEAKQAVAEVGKKKQDIKDQKDHIQDTQHASVPRDILEKEAAATTLEDDLNSKRHPIIRTSMIIAVAASSKEELDVRINKIKTTIAPIVLEVPMGDQFTMFNEAMIGGERYQTDYIQPLPPDNLALLTPGTSAIVGDDTGTYMGKTGGLGKTVHIDLSRPSRIHKPPNVVVAGNQGAGKSFCADLLNLKTAKYLGSKALFIDPKKDRNEWDEAFKSFRGNIEITTFTALAEDYGKIDPYIVLGGNKDAEDYPERMKEASILAMDILMFLRSYTRKSPGMHDLMEATAKAEKADKPCMYAVIEALRELSEKAKDDGDTGRMHRINETIESLISFSNVAYAGLIFGKGDEKALTFDKLVNVVQIENLTFPDEGKDQNDFSYQEIIGYACMLALTGFVKRFVMEDRTKLSVVQIDEASVFNATPSGKNVMNKTTRMARALLSPIVIIGQSVDDAGDEKTLNNIGYKFIFRMDNTKEIKKALAFLKLEDSEENIKLIEGLENGTCLFQDHSGRTAIVTIDPIFDEYIEGLDTSPPGDEEDE